jgi:6-phosphogluconolactonase (cycloisomerase 2 family)
MAFQSFLKTVTLTLAVSSITSATFVYVSSYAGTVTTVNLTLPGTAKSVSVNNACGPQASWLTLDRSHSLLYCANEGFDTSDGTLVSYNTTKNGTLLVLDAINTPGGPVHGVLFGEQNQGLALAS